MKTSELIQEFKDRDYEVSQSKHSIQLGYKYIIYPNSDDMTITESGVYTSKDLDEIAIIHEYLNTPRSERRDHEEYKLECPVTGFRLTKHFQYKGDELIWQNIKNSTSMSIDNWKKYGVNPDHYTLIDIDEEDL